jgi:para-aminobenzoate N-oxygenase AurF
MRAFVDIDWNDPELRVASDDPRWRLPSTTPLGSMGWYIRLPTSLQAQIGLHQHATAVKRGMAFEAELCQGILSWIRSGRPSGAEARYGYHVVAEETEHSLMFQEFIRQSGVNPPEIDASVSTPGTAAQYGDSSPAMLFLYGIAFEDASDWLQRDLLAAGGLHPLLEQMFRLHLREEARHKAFARSLLRNEVARLLPPELQQVRRVAPLVVMGMARALLDLGSDFCVRFNADELVLLEYRSSPRYQTVFSNMTRALAKFCQAIGLVDHRTAHVWEGCRIAL